MATLYRKYRSRTFDEVIGQDPIVKTLTNQIKLGRVGHAYLFTGSRGVGKTSCARIFARAVNCLQPVDGNPCGKCEACKKLAADNVDIIEMDAASNNGVDDARDIREKVKYLPVSCRYKVYIIDEVHMLTGGAFNALLKTIEEPPDHVIFILATTEPQKLPQTILSRCIRFDFKLVPTDKLAAHIASIYDAEGIKYTKDAVEEIARLGEGSVRDALSVADTLASAAEEITAQVVLDLTGAGDSSAVAQLFERTAECDLGGVLDAVNVFAENGKSMSAVIRQLIDYTRNVLVAKSVGKQAAMSGSLINADRDTLLRILVSAEKYSMQQIAYILESLGNAESGLKYSVNPRVFLETSLVKTVCGRQREDDILRRLSALENNSADTLAEQKKNKVIYTPPAEHTVEKAMPAEEKVGYVTEPNGTNKEPEYDVYTDLEPPPDISDNSAYEIKSRDVPKRTVNNAAQVKAESADEGEFRHLSASSGKGLELFGSIVRALRKSGTPGETRVFKLLARGATAKERDDCIAFVAPDDVFLQIGGRDVLDVLDAVLDRLGIKKRAKAERTDDDLLQSDIERAKELFGKDGVFCLL